MPCSPGPCSPRWPATPARLAELLDEARRTDDSEPALVCLDALARVAAESGDADRARTLLAEADELHGRLRHLVDDADRVDAVLARSAVG